MLTNENLRIATMATAKTGTSAPRYDAAELTIALVSGVALAMTALFVCVAPLTGQIAGARDFVVYWATGQQLVHHASPYDWDAMMRVERSAGLPIGYGVLFMRNPPWGLPIAYLLGFVGVRIGALLWSVALLALLWGSVHSIWQMSGRPRHLLNFLGFSFAPALVCLIVGQTSLFALAGLVLFLRFHNARPFLAGAALWLCALKPHLFLPFAIVLLAWIVVKRAYQVLLGAVIAMAASCAAAWLMDPHAWTEYSQMMRTYGIEREFIPCWSVVLRLWTRPDATWIQYILPALGCAWALAYFWQRRQRWDWLHDGGLVILVSIFAAPYCWLFDQALVIPALLCGAYATRSKTLLILLAVASLAIEVGMVLGVKLPSALYLWTAPAWLLWYVFAIRSKQEAIAA